MAFLKIRTITAVLAVLLATSFAPSAFAGTCERLQALLKNQTQDAVRDVYSQDAGNAYTYYLMSKNRWSLEQANSIPRAEFSKDYVRDVVRTGQWDRLADNPSLVLSIRSKLAPIEQTLGLAAAANCDVPESVGALLEALWNPNTKAVYR